MFFSEVMVHHRNGHQVSIGHQVSLSHIRGFLGLRQERDSRRPVVLNDAGERRGVNHDHCKIKKDMTCIYIYIYMIHYIYVHVQWM